jgi:hypothetical protein
MVMHQSEHPLKCFAAPPEASGKNSGIRFLSLATGRSSLLMRSLIDPHWWTAGLASIVQLVFFLRWLYRRIRNEELMRSFVKDMATNHLPHIYKLLEKICDQQGIERNEPSPQIRWIDLNQRRQDSRRR